MTLAPKAWTIDNPAWARAKPQLSVLIPFLRDDPAPLLRALDLEAVQLDGAVELIALDDGTNDDALAERVAGLVGQLYVPARFIRLRVNQGRSRGRNRLAADARGGHYLFLDSDMAPDSPRFLQNWLDLVRGGDPALAFGGFTLDQTPKTREHALHRAVSLLADCQPASVRAREPEKLLCTSNLLVRTDVFHAEAFDEAFKGWGWEDVEWASRVSRRWPVLHIDNTASHLGLDTDRALLAKYEQSPANFARMAAKHPEKVAAFPSYRLARRLKPVPGRKLLERLARSAALASGLPMRLRALAAKLYRVLLYAEVIG